MRTMAMLDAPPRSDSILPMNALSLPSSMFVVDMDVPPSKSYSLNQRSPGNAVEYTSVGSAIMPAETLSRVLAEQLHPAAQVIPALVNLNMPPTCLRRNQARCLRWVKTGKAQCEQMFSELPLKADIARRSRHVRFVPSAEVADHLVATGKHWLRWSFGQPGSPQSFFISREIFGTSKRAHHVFEGGNM